MLCLIPIPLATIKHSTCKEFLLEVCSLFTTSGTALSCFAAEGDVLFFHFSGHSALQDLGLVPFFVGQGGDVSRVFPCKKVPSCWSFGICCFGDVTMFRFHRKNHRKTRKKIRRKLPESCWMLIALVTFRRWSGCCCFLWTGGFSMSFMNGRPVGFYATILSNHGKNTQCC